MKIDIVARPGAEHQIATAEALRAGMAQHGDVTRIIGDPANAHADIVACWGWRMGRRLQRPGRRVLVMERGYVGDRFSWTSLGWDGLNGRARFPIVDDVGGRWDTHFNGLLQPEREGGDYAVLLGQVKGDTALEGMGAPEHWYGRAAGVVRERRGLPVYFRPHPVEIERKGYPANGYLYGLPLIEGDLSTVLSGAAVAVAWNSNALTDAALAGVPVIACDAGAMAWPIAGRGLQDRPGLHYRETWAHRLAWCQWRPEEIKSGAAWDALKTALPTNVPAWKVLSMDNRCLDAFA